MLAEPAEPHDIVIVATPPFTHCELTCAALSTSRHVLCEKPLAMNRAQAIHMLDLARAKNLLLGCCSDRQLGTPTAVETKRLIQSGALGTLYHARFINRQQRDRPGIEYQPTSPWFSDQSKSGGGILMDRGPYDFTFLNDLLQPRRVDVLSAWMASPTTVLSLPQGTIFDVEEHVGATLRYHLADGTTMMVIYERSGCTHGEEQSITEIEGLQGAVSWDYSLMPRKYSSLTHSYDKDGNVESIKRTFPIANSTLMSWNKPLYYFFQRLHGEPSPAVVNEQAVFNFSCIRAIYDCALSGEVQSVVWEDFATS
jgi:predicted dehydrogenase